MLLLNLYTKKYILITCLFSSKVAMMKTPPVSSIPAGSVRVTVPTSGGSHLGLASSKPNRRSAESNSNQKILTNSVSITQAGKSFTAELISMPSTLTDMQLKLGIMEGTRQVLILLFKLILSFISRLR